MNILKKFLFSGFFLAILFLLPVFSVSAQVVKPIRILIVPGHDNEVYGAKYNGLKEADMALALGNDIFDNLKKDKRFQVFITRDDGGYTKDFSDYFNNHMSEIKTFKEDAKKKMAEKVKTGTFVTKPNGYHISVKEPVALKLYGLNKWENENDIDVVIHIHFNDDGRKNKSKPGKYSGFSVYMPDLQLPSGALSAPLALNIFKELNKKYHSATNSKINGGVISDQKLIVMGANGTLSSSVRTVLIEYGFIYEKQFRTYTSRKTAFQNRADITANAIVDYFFPKK